MRGKRTETEVREFKDGIIRFMSNFALMSVKQSYMDNKDMFDSGNYSIHDHGEDPNAEGGLSESYPVIEGIIESDKEQSEAEEEDTMTKEESAAKFPFYWCTIFRFSYI